MGPCQFVKLSLEKILQLAYKKHVDLKQSATFVLELLKQPNAEQDMKEYTLKYIKPFDLAIETKYDKVQEIAIDCLQKLMAFGIVSNNVQVDSERTLLDVVVVNICNSFEISQSDNVQLQIIKALLTAVTTSNVSGTSLRLTIKTCFNISISTKNQDNARTSKTALTQMLNKVFQRLESYKNTDEYVSHFVKRIISNVISKNDPNKTPLSSYHRDAFFIFRALCKLSKQVPNSNSSESLEMKSRILSLQMISAVLANSGPVFRTSYSFIMDIKQHLCLSLLKNIVSTNSTIFNLSLSIFRTLVMYFKDHLKNEIGTLLSNALLKILESSNSTYQHKILVIQAIHTIIQDPQTLVDFFVNYDSGMQYVNIYESIVKDLSKLIQTTMQEYNWVSLEQELKIKGTALKTIVSILKSMVNWTKRIQKEEKPLEATIDPEVFEKQRNLKKGIMEAVSLFAVDEKKGIKFAIETDLIKDTPESIAKFLHSTEHLNKKSIGQYLGSHKHKAVLDAYCKLFDFKGQNFVTSLRTFLNAFRLPSEGQQIDMVVQKFAEQYYADNKDENFHNTDACYVFTYSVIMLNTELHNPQFAYRERMTFATFKKQNEGMNELNDGTKANFSDEFQEVIYNSIKTEEIKLKGEEDQVKMAQLQEMKEKDVKKKQMLFDKEGDYIFSQTSSQLSNTWNKHYDDTFFYANEIEHVKPMWDVSYGPILPALSGIFEKTDDLEIAKLCLEGFEYAIHISAMFDMTLPRDTYINALYKFTALSGLTHIREKNLEAIKLLIKIAQTEGNYLKNSWSIILNSLSKLERLATLGQGQKEKTLGRQGSMGGGMSRKVSMDIRHSNDTENAQYITNIDPAVIDKIYHASIDLDDEAIVEFVKCLCAVSSDEIFSSTEHRSFSLQKLIEVAHYNIGRIKLVWGKIWGHMSEHFIEVALKHDNERMIMGSIDSLRQLSMKFLEQDEMASYHFQRDFLKPFITIITHSNKNLIKEMIVEICNRMILHKSNNIKSGWKSIMAIFQVAAGDKGNVEKLAFENIEIIIKEYFSIVTEAFTDLINCLTIFGANQSNPEISTKAIDYIRICAAHLVDGHVIPIQEHDGFLFSEEKIHFKLWFPIFTGTSRLIGDVRKPIRIKALATLFDILNEYGRFYNPGLWQVIFKGVLYPIFVEIQTKDTYTEWINTTCEKAMVLMVGLFCKYFELIPFEFSNIINLILTTIRKEDELLTRIGHKSLLLLVNDASKHFEKSNWSSICETCSLFVDKLKSRDSLTVVVATNQLLTIQTVTDIMNSPNISSEHQIQLWHVLDALDKNAQETLEGRNVDKEVSEILFKQEVAAITSQLNILLKSKEKEFEDLLFGKTKILLERYLKYVKTDSFLVHKVLVPIIVLLLQGICDFEDKMFEKYVKEYYPMFCNLIMSTHGTVQASTSNVFVRIGKLIQ